MHKESSFSRIKAIAGKLPDAIKLFASFSLVWLMVILVLSGYEVMANRINHGINGDTMHILHIKLLFDTVFWLQTCACILIPFISCYFFSVRLAKLFYSVVLIVLTLIQILLIKYFSTAMVPLGADLYGYSWKDIQQTVGSAGGIKASLLIAILVFIAVLLLLLRLAARKIRIPFIPAIAFSACAILVMFKASLFPLFVSGLGSDFNETLVLNKSSHFIRQSYAHFFPEEEPTDIYSDNYIDGDKTNWGQAVDFQYSNETDYPFFHADNTKDVLSPFLTTRDKLPDIVIILVEGLGRAFTNEGAYLGNFTPFIDSLAKQSLYWENFLSEGGRTFAVLPSILGSLPFGRNGFLGLGDAMPSHLSLISVLKKNGYHSSFYYGGDAHFDNMDIFLQKNGIDELNDGKSFSPGYTRLPSNNGFTWGYNDKELFRRYLDTRKDETDQPQLSILLTVATHSPFMINEPEKYLNGFETRMEQIGLDEKAKNKHRPFKDQYASILYTDDALRNFFKTYSGRKNFQNTIFLITGDHRMPEIPMRTKIDRYHVPLLIYSPLLRSKGDFLSISTHFDITPSLLAFLGHAYNIKRPAGSHWMGCGLDTARGFRNIHSYPLMQTKTDLVDYILGESHLNGSTLFRLSADMNEEPLTDETQKEYLKNAFNKFSRRNEKWMNGGKLLPDSVYLSYGPH